MSAASRIAVLMGGRSAEREVSLASGREVLTALRDAGFEASTIEFDGDVGALVDRLRPAPDAVFNALHGRWGEDGCMQGLLELLGIPYTHSGVRASALAMDKAAARQLFSANGLPIAEGMLVPREAAHEAMAAPYVVKPRAEGSSVGVQIVHERDNAAPLAEWAFGEIVLVERYVAGRELTVAVMGDRPLAVTEIVSKARFYNYDSKYVPGGSEHIIPAGIDGETYDRAMEIALEAHRLLGCRGVSRADFRYDDTRGTPGDLVLLEVNTQPGLTPTSLVPEQAAHVGMSFGDLVRWMVEDARCDS